MAARKPLVLITGQVQELPAGDTVAGSGGVASGVVTVTVPNSRIEHTQTVSVPGLTSASRVLLSLAPVPVTAENDPEFLDLLALSGAPGADTLTVTLAFASRTSGPILLNYLAV